MYYQGLREAMSAKGDTQQDLANMLGFRSYISLNRRLCEHVKWKEHEIKFICKRYKKTKEELGF